MIGASLEARIRLFASGEALRFLERYAYELPTLLIVSQVEVVPLAAPGQSQHGAASTSEVGSAAQPISPAGSFWSGSELRAEVLPAQGEKCPRCWTYSKFVGRASDVCEKCAEALGR
jgi:isoleucyl-tRNA synthetase